MAKSHPIAAEQRGTGARGGDSPSSLATLAAFVHFLVFDQIRAVPPRNERQTPGERPRSRSRSRTSRTRADASFRSFHYYASSCKRKNNRAACPSPSVLNLEDFSFYFLVSKSFCIKNYVITLTTPYVILFVSHTLRRSIVLRISYPTLFVAQDC